MLIKDSYEFGSTAVDEVLNRLQGTNTKHDFEIHFFEPIKESFDKARELLYPFSSDIVFNNF